MAPASGIDPIEMMTNSQKSMAISGLTRHDSMKAASAPALRKNVRPRFSTEDDAPQRRAVIIPQSCGTETFPRLPT
jgi:hypothetical protein